MRKTEKWTNFLEKMDFCKNLKFFETLKNLWIKKLTKFQTFQDIQKKKKNDD